MVTETIITNEHYTYSQTRKMADRSILVLIFKKKKKLGEGKKRQEWLGYCFINKEIIYN